MITTSLTKKEDEMASQDNILYLIKKFQRQGGFEALSLEDLAVAVSLPEFGEQFRRHTGSDWATKFEVKALEKLRSAQFDMQWLVTSAQESEKPFFQFCERGDIAHVKDFLLSQRSNASDVKNAVEPLHKKSAVHVAAENGHAVLVEYLLMQHFKPNARDKQLRTPLHCAALKGYEGVCDTLLKYGANVSAVDGQGRSALHYASCASSANLVTLFIGLCPELVQARDNAGLAPLHYAVLNPTAKQIDVLRTLLENRADADVRDAQGKTPLFYAAEQGKTRAIPILLQKGRADVTLAETVHGKTALDVALNQRTRELLVVYSAQQLGEGSGGGTGGAGNANNNNNGGGGAQLEPKKEDIEWMNCAIKGQTYKKPPGVFDLPEGFHQQQQQQAAPTTNSQQQHKTGRQAQISEDIYPKNLKSGSSTMAAMSRERFFEMMKTVQEQGVKAFQHVKKPFIYTGSWMEGVQNLEDLYNLMSGVAPTEACLCAFNLLCPYDKPLPSADEGGMQEAVDGFFGDAWKSAIQKPMEERLQREKQLQLQLSRMEEIQIKLDVKDQALKERNEQLRQLSETVEKLQLQLQQGASNNKKQSKEAEDVERLQREAKDLKKRLIEKDMEIEFLKQENQSNGGGNNQGGNNNIENFQEVMRVREEQRLDQERAKMQRFKAGQVFLRALQNSTNNNNQRRGNKQQQQQSVQQQAQDNMQDDEAIIHMFKSLQNNPPNYIERLKQADGDGDGRLTQAEFMQYCSKLRLSQQDTLSLCRVSGFEGAGGAGARKLLGITEFVQILKNRPIERQQSEEKLFKKILDAIAQKGLTLEKLFQIMDTDGSGQVSSAEMRVGLANLKITLNQKDFNNIFCIFDKDKSDSISLEEMKSTLTEFEQKLRGGGGQDQEEEQGDTKGAKKNKNAVQQQQDQYEDKQREEEEQAFQRKMELVWQEENRPFEAEAEQINQDLQKLLSGKLKVQVIFVQNMLQVKPKQTLAIKLLLEGSEEDQIVEPHPTDDKGSIQFAQRLTIKLKKANELADYLKILVFSSLDLSEEKYLGEVAVCWKCCILNAGDFYINQPFTIVNTSYPGTKVSGQMGVQLRWNNEQIAPVSDVQRRVMPVKSIDSPRTPENVKQKRSLMVSANVDDELQMDNQEVPSNQQIQYKQQQQQQQQNYKQAFQKPTIDENELEDINSDINDLISPQEQEQLMNISNKMKTQRDQQFNNYVEQMGDQQAVMANINSDIDDLLSKSDFQLAQQEDLELMDSNISDL